jgi:hypothetical protein
MEIIYILLVIGSFLLLIWGLSLTKKEPIFQLSNIYLLVILGLIYDNFIIAIGKFIEEESLLKTLSYVRYWMHALFTPTLILFAWNSLKKGGIKLAEQTGWKIAVYIITFAIILYEIYLIIYKLNLEKRWEDGLLIFENTGKSGLPIMMIAVIGFLAFLGIYLWKKFRFPWLLFGILSLMIGSILSAKFKNMVIMNVFEYMLMISILLTRRFQKEVGS